LLDSNFIPTTGATSIFFLDKDSFSNVRPGKVFRIYLPTGFIDPTTIVLTEGDSWNACTDPVQAEDIAVDAEKGIIKVDELYHADKYIKVTYDYGVTASTMPEWLKEAILSFVPIMFYMPSSNSKADPGVNLKDLEQHANLVLDTHLRKAGFCIRAL
jgi:hypothetical protein